MDAAVPSRIQVVAQLYEFGASSTFEYPATSELTEINSCRSKHLGLANAAIYPDTFDSFHSTKHVKRKFLKCLGYGPNPQRQTQIVSAEISKSFEAFRSNAQPYIQKPNSAAKRFRYGRHRATLRARLGAPLSDR
jgi:hypothetical protein